MKATMKGSSRTRLGVCKLMHNTIWHPLDASVVHPKKTLPIRLLIPGGMSDRSLYLARLVVVCWELNALSYCPA